ncbi:MAG: carbohydrate binding family 9 domain-containing protein [Acidobacteria bacterium]|nr:carbohydrate binding family 9 domain-containing protein [Acidobacteriota bacterium]
MQKPIVLFRTLLGLSLLFLPWVSVAQEPPSNGKRIVRATYIRSPMVIDGDLSETAWEEADVAKDFLQRDPLQGSPSTERTEVRVLYDDKNIYVGAYCYYSQPQGIIVNDISRDFDMGEEDYFGVLYDTFNDDRNGFYTITTARGGQRDAQFLDEGRDFNLNWDGVWRVRTRIREDGWTAEFEVPFKTLRFAKNSQQIWGIQFFRRIRHKNEWVSWSQIPRRYSLLHVSSAGELQGLENVEPGKNLKIKPYVLGGVQQFAAKGTEGDFDGGADIKYGVTPSLTLDLTLNTDFSHVEADTQQVNLTRFPLFFPEKREFFLENFGMFQFGALRGREALLFHSRNIGLESGEPVPILGGVRLSGRAGPYYLGLMDIQTRSERAEPATNFAVARLRRDVFTNSNVGVVFINRQSAQPDDHNRSFGADVNFWFLQRDLRITGLLAKTQTPGRDGKDRAGLLEAELQKNLVRAQASYLDIGENFNPEVGFVRRPGRRILHGEFELRPRLQRDDRLGFLMRDISSGVVSDYAILPDGQTETKLLRPHFQIEFQDASIFRVQYGLNFERLTRPFRIRSGINIPVGDYRFNEFLVSYASDKSKLFSASLQYETGEFYEGRKKTWTVGGQVLANYQFRASINYERNSVSLPQGEFATDLVGFRANYAFNPQMFLNAFIQYNSDTQRISSNIRFRLIHRPLSDIYVVYNEQRDTLLDRNDRSVTLKYTHLLNF